MLRSTIVLLLFPMFCLAQEVDPVQKSRDDLPKTLGYGPGFVRYKRAEYTQGLSSTGGYVVHIITPISRKNLEPKYNIPGGLENSSDWESVLFKKIPAGEKLRIDRILQFSVRADRQYNRGWTRVYPEGSEFLDVLINTKTWKVFEARLAIKEKHRWDMFVDIRFRKERPEGFVPQKRRDCIHCHSDSLTTSYGGFQLPGSEGRYSDPVPDLETGMQKSHTGYGTVESESQVSRKSLYND